MKQIFSSLGVIGKAVLFGALGIVATVFVLCYQLFSLPDSKYSAAEVSAYTAAQSWKTIVDNPLDLPHKLLIWIASTLGTHTYAITRVSSVIFALLAVLLFYYVVRAWISKRIAILTTTLFALSNGFLHSGRLGTAAILQCSVLFLFALPIIIQRSRPQWRRRIVYASSVVFAALLYVPGLIWQIILTVVLRRKKLFTIWSRLTLLQKLLMSLASLAVASPLIWAFIQNSKLVLTWLGLPQTFPSVATILDNAQTLASTMFYHAGFSPEYVTHGGALLTSAEIILLILGFYAQLKPPRHNTNYYLLGALVIATILVLVSGGAFIPALIPLLYLLIAGGIYYFLNEWLTVFPKNPIARAFGIAVIVVILIFAAGYHLRSYFQAWPNNTVTKQIYTIRQR